MKSLLWSAALLASTPSLASINDVFAMDYEAAAAGKTILTGYLYDRQGSGPYVAGQRRAPWQGESQIAALRLSHFGDLAGTRAAATVVVAQADQTLSGPGIPANVNKSESGYYDLRLTATVWPITDRKLGRHLAASLTWLPPTGSYRRDGFQNIGENRHRGAVTLAWIEQIDRRWTLEALGELGIYGKNSNSFPGRLQLDQAHSAAVTTFLRYHLGGGQQVYGGYQRNLGGETFINGQAQHDSLRNHRLMLGLIQPIMPGHILNLRLAKEIKTDSGFAIDQEIAVRWVCIF